MKHLLVSASYRITAVLLMALCFTPAGCRDSASISEQTVEVPLSSLTITPPGSLQPAFSSNTTTYAATVPTAVTSVTVTASPRDSTTTLIINGVTTPAGQGHPVSLGQPGSTTPIEVVASSQNGIESTYNVTVTRLSDDDNVSALQVTANSIVQSLDQAFDAKTLDYKADVSNTVQQVTVVATKSDPNATMLMSAGSSTVTIGPGINTGQLPITLSGPGTSTLVSIEITAPNGNTKTYQITVNRLSGNNTLRELSVIPGTFNQPFDPTITAYLVTTPTIAEQVTVTATKSDRLAAMSGNVTAGTGLETGTGIFQLGAPGSEIPLSITVAAPDPTVPPREYRITVKRAVPSNNANLSALTTDAGSLDPPIFNPDTKSYDVKVGLLFPGNVKLTATKSDSNATMSALGSVIALPGVPTGQVTITPGFGIGTTVNIDVRAEDGVNSTTYRITAIRGLF
ncbi:MAG: cadherin-like beta sandwich domain-containing protein [Nitrospira sp.]|nr:cadherin-like beta sandwich domain-containing protein [Nitrospira sp.]MDH4303159.1 cadherin-like beta sandwich domain-containing protein [Nitrospira sp.]MDH5194325.1 cadherin-like beta sandwich domain-containing protein [Nitrospira sp.]